MLFSMKFQMEVKEQSECPASGRPRPRRPVTAGTLPFPGVTFSFFWKTQGEQARPSPSAYGGQVISDGFKVCSSGGKGSVELYTRDNSMTWEATFSPPGEGAVPGGGAVGGGAGGPDSRSRWPCLLLALSPFLSLRSCSGRLPGGGLHGVPAPRAGCVAA